MAIARLLDCRLGDGVITAPNTNQEHYVNWVRFIRHCETNGLCTVIASQYGSGGTGEDFHDQANPAGENAFTYAEWGAGSLTFGILVQWADGSNFGTSPGDPALNDDSQFADGVAVAMAFREDGGSPWNGTTGDTGANTKGTPVWTAGVSTLHVFPRSNNPGPPLGDHDTNKENMLRVGQDFVSNFARCHFVANEDGIFSMFDNGDGGDYRGCCYMGRYTPRTGLGGVLTFPYCVIRDTGALMWSGGSGAVYGGTDGNDSENGGIVGLPADGVMNAAISFPSSGSHNAAYQPNNLISPNEYEGGRFAVFQRETTLGLAGYLPTELLAHFYGTANLNTNAAADRAYIGDNTVNARKWGISWDGGAVPGTNTTRTGRLSFTP